MIVQKAFYFSGPVFCKYVQEHTVLETSPMWRNKGHWRLTDSSDKWEQTRSPNQVPVPLSVFYSPLQSNRTSILATS